MRVLLGGAMGWRLLFTGFGCAFFAAPAMASPWGQGSSDLLTIQTYGWYRASGDGREFDQQTVETYAELGLTSKTTLGGKLSWATQEQTFATSAATAHEGINDAEIFIQHRVWEQDEHILAGYGLYAPQTTLTSLTAGEAQGHDAAVELGVTYGRGGEQTFKTIQLGYRESLGNDAGQLRGQAKVGRHLGSTLLLAEAYSTFGLQNPVADGQDYDVATLSASVAFRVTANSRLQIGASQDIYGRNLDKGHRLFVSYWFEP